MNCLGHHSTSVVLLLYLIHHSSGINTFIKEFLCKLTVVVFISGIEKKLLAYTIMFGEVSTVYPKDAIIEYVLVAFASYRYKKRKKKERKKKVIPYKTWGLLIVVRAHLSLLPICS